MRRLSWCLLFVVGCSAEDARQLVVHVRTDLSIDRLERVDVDLTIDGEKRDGTSLKREGTDGGELGSFGVVPESDADDPSVRIDFNGTLDDAPFTASYNFASFHPDERLPVFVCLTEDTLCADATSCAVVDLPDHGAPGEAWSTCLVDTTTMPPDPPEDGDPEGAAGAYAVALGGGGDQEPLDVVRLPDGGDLVVGRFTGTLDLGGARTADGIDGFVLALDPDGNPRWSWWLTGAGDDAAFDVVTAGTDVYVAGSFNDTLRVEDGAGTAATLTSLGGADAFVLRFSTEGSFVAETALGSTGDAAATAVAVRDTADGPIVVVGGTHRDPLEAETDGCTWSQRTDVLPGATIDRGFVVSLDEAFACRWGVTLAAVEDVAIDAIAIEGSGDVFAAGRFTSELPLPGEIAQRRDTLPAPDGGAADAFVLTVRAGGFPSAAARIGGVGVDHISSISGDNAELLITGEFGAGPRTLDANRTIGADGRRVVALGMGVDLSVPWTLEVDAEATVLATRGDRLVSHRSTVVVAFSGTLMIEDADPLVAPNGSSALARIDLMPNGTPSASDLVVTGRANATGLASANGGVTVVGDYTGALDRDDFSNSDGRDGFLLRQ